MYQFARWDKTLTVTSNLHFANILMCQIVLYIVHVVEEKMLKRILENELLIASTLILSLFCS